MKMRHRLSLVVLVILATLVVASTALAGPFVHRTTRAGHWPACALVVGAKKFSISGAFQVEGWNELSFCYHRHGRVIGSSIHRIKHPPLMKHGWRKKKGSFSYSVHHTAPPTPTTPPWLVWSTTYKGTFTHPLLDPWHISVCLVLIGGVNHKHGPEAAYCHGSL